MQGKLKWVSKWNCFFWTFPQVNVGGFGCSRERTGKAWSCASSVCGKALLTCKAWMTSDPFQEGPLSQETHFYYSVILQTDRPPDTHWVLTVRELNFSAEHSLRICFKKNRRRRLLLLSENSPLCSLGHSFLVVFPSFWTSLPSVEWFLDSKAKRLCRVLA